MTAPDINERAAVVATRATFEAFFGHMERGKFMTPDQVVELFINVYAEASEPVATEHAIRFKSWLTGDECTLTLHNKAPRE